MRPLSQYGDNDVSNLTASTVLRQKRGLKLTTRWHLANRTDGSQFNWNTPNGIQAVLSEPNTKSDFCKLKYGITYGRLVRRKSFSLGHSS